MPARKDGRIEKGQRVASALSARAWNRAQQAADVVLGVQPELSATHLPVSVKPYTWMYAKNLCNRDLDRFSVVNISSMDLGTQIEQQLNAGSDAVVMSIDVPQDPRSVSSAWNGSSISISPPKKFFWGVVTEPVANGSVARVAVSGVIPVKALYADGVQSGSGYGDDFGWNYRYARTEPGTTSHVVIDAEGDAAVLWVGPTVQSDGNKWALIRLGDPPKHIYTGTTVSLAYRETWFVNTWKLVDVIDPRGYGPARAQVWNRSGNIKTSDTEQLRCSFTEVDGEWRALWIGNQFNVTADADHVDGYSASDYQVLSHSGVNLLWVTQS